MCSKMSFVWKNHQSRSHLECQRQWLTDRPACHLCHLLLVIDILSSLTHLGVPLFPAHSRHSCISQDWGFETAVNKKYKARCSMQSFADYNVINRNGSHVYNANAISLTFRSFFFCWFKTNMKTKVSRLHRSSHSRVLK